MKCKAIIFDMDDTLFLEKYYVLSGFKQVSLFLNEQFGIDTQESYKFLENRFENYGRNKIFDLLLQKNSSDLGVVNIDSLIIRLVKVYRNHEPDIKLNPIVVNILKKIRKKKIKIAIATDGLPKMQRNKFYALGLDRLVDEMVCCWDHDAAKPSIKCFKIAARMLNVNIKNCVIVGDHPQHDIVPARILGAISYRVKTGRFYNLNNDRKHPPHNEFSSLTEFFKEIIEYEY